MEKVSANKVHIINKIFIDEKIPAKNNKTYFSLAKICKDYFCVTVKKFIGDNPDVKLYQEKGKKSFYVSVSNLLPCLEKSSKPRVKKLMDTMNGIIDAEIKKATNSDKLKDIDQKISMSDHIEFVNKKIIEEANTIPNELTGPGSNPIKLTLISADDPDFMKQTECPEHTHVVFKKLSIPLFKLTHGGETTYYIRHVTLSKYFGRCDFMTRMLDITKNVIDDEGHIQESAEEDDDSFEMPDKKVKHDDMSKFNSIDKKFFVDLKKISAKNVFVYSMQRQLWPDEKKYFNGVTNKYEFEMLHVIIMKMSDVFYFDFQVRLATHRVDALLYRKGNFTRAPQPICVEIDILLVLCTE